MAHDEDDRSTRHPGSEALRPKSTSAGPSLFERGSGLAMSRNSLQVPATPALVQPGEILTGKARWQIGRRLGKGGFGAVFLGRRLDSPTVDGPPETAAIKVFHAPAGHDPRQLLKRELAALLALKSERIPSVCDWSIDEGLCFVAMQYYSRGSLWDVRKETPRMKPGAAWTLLLDLLAALKDAHHASLLHLDVKPGNVLISDSGGFVLTDFGVAQSSFSSGTTGVAGLGTVGYQAPEQARRDANSFDARTDLFGVGATVWSQVTGIELARRTELLTLNSGSGQSMPCRRRASLIARSRPRSKRPLWRCCRSTPWSDQAAQRKRTRWCGVC